MGDSNFETENFAVSSTNMSMSSLGFAIFTVFAEKYSFGFNSKVVVIPNF